VGNTLADSTATAQWLPENAQEAGVLVTDLSARFEPAGQ
jgi:hypothetical protein